MDKRNKKNKIKVFNRKRIDNIHSMIEQINSKMKSYDSDDCQVYVKYADTCPSMTFEKIQKCENSFGLNVVLWVDGNPSEIYLVSRESVGKVFVYENNRYNNKELKVLESFLSQF